MNDIVSKDKLQPSAGFEGIAFQGVSRRAFLLSSGALAIGVAFGGTAKKAFGQGAGQSLMPNAWVQVATDGTVTIVSPASEMGQGVMTAMPLLVAEDMDLDWSRCKVVQAPSNPKLYGNPRFGGGMSTGASRTTQGYYEILRTAGHQARQILMMAAAERWGVPLSEVTTEPHKVVHRFSGKQLDYGEIAAFARVPAEPPKVDRTMLKPSSAFRFIGTDVPRIDVPDKTTGKAVFGIDVRLPDMLYGAVLRSPVQGDKAETIDDAAAKAIPGVVSIVPMPWGVGVIARDYAAARKAKAALKVTWTQGSKARAYDSEAAAKEFLSRARNPAQTGVDFIKEGDARGAMAGAVKTFTAEYVTEHVAHACMEPMTATALVKGESIEMWAPSQSPTFVLIGLTRALGYKPENIKTNITLLGGGFGRKIEFDYILDAAILAKAVEGRPVKVIWSREDDIQHDKYRPLTAQILTAGVDAQGRIVALQHRIVAESIYARAAPPLFQQSGGKDAPVNEGSEIVYGVHNHLVEYLREQRGVDVGFWRAVGPGYTKFSIETLIDEVASALNRDPVEYRLSMLEKQPRAAAVIREAAAMAGWGKRKLAPGRALGVAYSDAWNTHVAQVAEVSVDRRSGAIRVHDVWSAIDCGIALQPANVAAQVEGNIIFGLSQAIHERITFKGGAVQQSNFHDYKLLRMSEAPRIHVKVMPTNNYPGGVGEAGLPPIAPAVANAVMKLTGKKLRSMPFDTRTLKA